MQNWTTPQLQELDVRLTAKMPDYQEREEEVVNGYYIAATFDATEAENPCPWAPPPSKPFPQS